MNRLWSAAFAFVLAIGGGSAALAQVPAPPPADPGGLMPPTNAVAPVTAPVATGPVQVKTQAEYDALPKGAKYIRADGKVAIKK